MARRNHSFAQRVVATTIAGCLIAVGIGSGAAGAQPHHGRPKHPPITVTAPAPGPTSLADWLLERAVGAFASQAFGFVFSEIGLAINPVDPTAKLLADLKSQLDAISAQLTAVQASVDSLTADVLQGNFELKFEAARTDYLRIKDLYDTAFRPLVTKAQALQAARDAGDPSAISAASAALVAQRNTFYARYDSYPYGAIAGNIHDFLVPDASQSILAAKGKQIMQAKRYLTDADSAQLRALHTGLAQWEALAGWMRMERYIPSDPAPPAPTGGGDLDVFNEVRTDYLAASAAEYASLPPAIPAGVVIDLAGPPSARTTTNNTTMWLPGSGGAANLTFRTGASGPGTVPDAVAAANTAVAGGFDDWQIPGRSDVERLLGGFSPAAGTTPNDFLTSLNPTSELWQATANKWPFIWSNDTAQQTVTCEYSNPFSPYSGLYLSLIHI